MKKLLTALIAFVMCFSVVTTAFAATPDEISESDVASEIRQVMIDTYYGGKEPEYLSIEIVGSTSDGGVYFMHNEGFSLIIQLKKQLVTILIITTMAMMLCFIRMAMFTQLKRLMKAELLTIVFLKNCQR
ncbi:hypothetical protein DW745_09860 [Ruminococcus sp. AM28-29LB]|nr:hypothetical protein [Ruminococcus sp. AM28-29LB]RGH85987.1 hypothetical protein DW745_09860 [Ruminococcus sp. AM28-29LB]